VPHGERTDWRAAKQAYLARLREGTAAGLEACREEYRQGVERMSEVLLASLLDELERLGLRERTAIAFLSDHGESWGERLTDKSCLEGIYHLHGATLHDEILDVPLILSAPGRIAPATVDAQVSTVDVAPTLCELAGIAPFPCDGRSLLGRAPDGGAGDHVLAATSDRGVLSQLAIRRPPWKVIRHLATGREEAYRLDVDPRELVDRAVEAPAELSFLLTRELDDVEVAPLDPEQEAVVIARLADLGYL
jgi:choline-sulfatase